MSTYGRRKVVVTTSIKGERLLRDRAKEVAGKLKMVDPDASIIREAKMLGISFGDE
mgnify:CR=1 FL=1